MLPFTRPVFLSGFAGQEASGIRLMQKANGKDCPPSQLTPDLYAALMGLNNQLGQGQAQTGPLCILRKTAAVKALENMIQVLRVNAVSCILHRDLGQIRGLVLPYQDAVSLVCVIQGVFHKIPYGL